VERDTPTCGPPRALAAGGACSPAGYGLSGGTDATPLAGPTAFAAGLPGDEGGGAFHPRGRGGRVIAVTNLNDSGRVASAPPGGRRTRTRRLRSPGVIAIDSLSKLTTRSITIAARPTAPGDGHLRPRPTTEFTPRTS